MFLVGQQVNHIVAQPELSVGVAEPVLILQPTPGNQARKLALTRVSVTDMGPYVYGANSPLNRVYLLYVDDNDKKSAGVESK